MSPVGETERPLLRVVRGEPTHEELAALVAVVAARASVAPGRSSGDDSVWSDRGRLVRAPLHAGPGAWRASVLPR
ncbi:acyl-CoA carboxylase subunit epsilon [soil metagenome]